MSPIAIADLPHRASPSSLAEPAQRLRLDDLPLLRDLTPEQLKELFGAGRFQPRVEQLENRLVQSAVSLRGAALSVVGTDLADNLAIVQSDTDNSLKVIFNGVTSTFDSSKVTKINVNLKGGDDHAEFLFNDVAIQNNLSLKAAMGAGDDAIDAVYSGHNNAQLNLLLDGGAGKDSVHADLDLQAGSAGKLSAQIKGGTGDDELRLNLLDYSGGAAKIIAVVDGGTGLADTGLATPNVTVKNCEPATSGMAHVQWSFTANVQATNPTSSAALNLGGLSIGLDATTRMMYVVGNGNDDQAKVSIDTHGNSNPLDDEIVAVLSGYTGDVGIVGSNVVLVQRFARYVGNVPAIYKIVFWGRAGNDIFENNTDIDSDADGEEGDDKIIGGSRNDSVWGGPGVDYIVVGAGNNLVYGGDNDDLIVAGLGSNTLYGEGGRDRIYGGASFDEIHGGDGDDRIYAGDGNDLVYAGAGADWAFGQAGNDSVLGDSGEDHLEGNDGFDLVYGGDDDDWVVGGEDDDYCFGGDGFDIVSGGGGDDRISGATLRFSATDESSWVYPDDWNSDWLYGDAGHDYIVVGDWHWFAAGYMDDALDETADDNVEYEGDANWVPAPADFYWGHLYGTTVYHDWTWDVDVDGGGSGNGNIA